jgi:hypothetical protein
VVAQPEDEVMRLRGARRGLDLGAVASGRP